MIDFITFCDYTGTFALRLAASVWLRPNNLIGSEPMSSVWLRRWEAVRSAISCSMPPLSGWNRPLLIISALALLFVIIFPEICDQFEQYFLHFRCHRAGTRFGVVGIEGRRSRFSMWVAVVMGTITGAFGGMIRDIPDREVPLIFRKRYLCAGMRVPEALFLCMHADGNPGRR